MVQFCGAIPPSFSKTGTRYLMIPSPSLGWNRHDIGGRIASGGGKVVAVLFIKSNRQQGMSKLNWLWINHPKPTKKYLPWSFKSMEGLEEGLVGVRVEKGMESMASRPQ